MFSQYRNVFTDREKQVIYSLLTRVMDADDIQKDEEKSYLSSMSESLCMSEGDILASKDISLDECKESLAFLDENKRIEVKNMLITMANADGVYVKQEQDFIESLKLDISRHELELIAEWRDEEQMIVGFYTQKKDGRYCFEDIRSLRFSELKYKDEGEIVIELDQALPLELNKYYEFSWTTQNDNSERGFHIVPKVYKFKMVQPKELVERLYDNWKNKDYDTIKQMSEVQRMVNTQLTASSDGTFIYELLQNANDYPVKIDDQVQLVDVEFHITEHYLIYRHTGKIFSPRNIAAISKMSDGEKKKEKNAIGYKGIGFKTVFSENQYVYLESGEYTLRFDESITRTGLGSSKFPWQIMPIWTPKEGVAQEVIDAMANSGDFRVQMAIRPDDTLKLRFGDKSFEYIFNDIFKDEKDILFIPNIRSVKVFYDGKEQICRIKDPEKWAMTQEPLVYKFTPEELESNNLEVATNKRIPEKYKDFEDTRISFACQREGRKLIPVERARVYCYLPTQVSLGFPFLMNTDMIPTGPRDDFEKKVKFNHKIITIAGRKLAEWLQSLLLSGSYEYDSVYSLVPAFNKVENYEDFVSEMQASFEEAIAVMPFVPVLVDGQAQLKFISKIIYDTTGISKSGIMSDEELLSFVDGHGTWTSNPDEFFAHPDVRGEQNFDNFLNRYRAKNMEFSQKTILSLCNSEDFNKWLSNKENNLKFLNFLLTNDHLPAFIKERKKIFLGSDGILYAANEIYENIDEVMQYIPMFGQYIPHLAQSTRLYFINNSEWDDAVENRFKPFVASEMIANYILSNEDAVALLNVPSNSVAFYRYLAVKKVDLKANKTKIPYITEDGGASTDYTNYHYFFNEDAHGLTHEKWLGENVINVLSHIYFDSLDDYEKDNITAIFANLGFNKFTKDSFVTTVIVGDADFRAKVNAAIENNYAANKAFVEYVFCCEAQLKENCFKDYVLCCVDISHNEVYLCNDDVRYFNQDAYAQNSTYAENIHHAWLQDSMMYALSNAYFEGREKEEVKKLESFLRQQFGVKTFTDKSFFTDVVIKNKAVIYAGLVDKATMLTFLEYLKRDADRLFDDTMSFNDIKDMPLLAYDGTIVRARELNIQYIEYDEDAKTLCKKAWCPKTYVVLSQKYTDDFSQDMRQLFKIVKFDINTTTDILAQNAKLRQLVNIINNNIDFWRWVNQKQIASVDKFKAIPLLDKNNTLIDGASLYISDTYQQEQIEALVTKYVKEAQFVSSSYIKTANENEKAEWMKLFKKLGLKSDNKDILFSDILPKLSSIETESLDSVVAMMSKHLKDLKDKWTERKHQIMQLRVRTQSAGYKTLDQVIIVNVDEDSVSEPFKYITLANEVHPDILKANKDLLLAISEAYDNRNLITTKQMWIDAKVKDYLAKFAADENSVADIHIQFVREVAKIQSEYDINDTLRKQIKYLVKSNETTYKFAHELTLGTSYSPTCDFEANGVSELPYLSDTYIFEGNKDTIKQYFKAENLHQNMTREDLKYLANRTFACYFWSKCFSRRLSEYETWITEGRFNNLVCIPTENSVQKPELLYAPHIAGYAVRAKAPQWQEKIPCKTIIDSIDNRDARELFEKINFCKALSFEDCLYYLAHVSHSREDESYFRSVVIDWMLSSPIQDANLVDRYRKTPTAEWRNGKGQKKHITELYAIHPDATQERNIFRGDEFVMQTSAFPNDTDSFVKACDILKITYLKSSDFVATPIGKQDETANIVAILRPRLLVLSAIENPDRFQELYERYNTKLSQYHFVVCDKIDLGYSSIHNDVERIYNDDTHLYYVSSWKHNRTFTKFCSRLKRLVGFDVYDNVCEDVLDDSVTVEACIEKYCSSLAYDEKFRTYLKSLDLTFNVESEEEEPIETESDYYSDATNESTYSTTEQTTETSIENKRTDYPETIREDDKPAVPNTDVTSRPVGEPEGWKDAETSPQKSAQTASLQPTSGSRQQHQSQQTESPVSQMTSPTAYEEPEDDLGQYDTYDQVDEEDIENYDVPDETDDEETKGDEDVDTTDNDNSPSSNTHTANLSRTPSNKPRQDYDPDRNGYMGSVDKDKDYQPVGDKPYKPRTRKHPKNFTKEEVERLRSHGAPLELESLPATDEELEILAQCNISPEQIADTNYLAQLRLYQSLADEDREQLVENMSEFIHNANDVAIHEFKDGRYIHTSSAARGVMYIGPTIWNKMVDDKGRVCVYLDGKGKNFAWINSSEEFLKLVEKDDVVIKITGKEKVDVVKALYTGILEGVKGTAYTLIRVAARTNMDAVFAHYVGAMAEEEDGNEDSNEYGD